jgi:hypothetical protein
VTLYHDPPPLVLIRSKRGRPQWPPADSQGLGLTPRQKKELRNQGFTKLEIQFLAALAEIRQMLRESEERSAANGIQIRC